MPSVAIRRSVPVLATPVAPQRVQEEVCVAAPAVAAIPQIILRRSGTKPYRFAGSVLAEANGYSSTCNLWHEINLYRHDDGGYVVNIRTFAKSASARDGFFVRRVDTMEDVLEVLEKHDAALDIKVSFSPSDQITPATAMLKAVALRTSIDEAVRDYRALAGEVMYQLSFLPDDV